MLLLQSSPCGRFAHNKDDVQGSSEALPFAWTAYAEMFAYIPDEILAIACNSNADFFYFYALESGRHQSLPSLADSWAASDSVRCSAWLKQFEAVML